MAQLSQLLLFDPDPSGLDTLTYGFEKEGCAVAGTADPVKARDLIQAASPALVVVNLRDSDQGFDLIRATTSNPRTRNLPCVAIGKEELRAAALGAGAFVFLSTPLFVRDVISACRLVAAASVPGSRPSPDAEISLRLGEIDGIYYLVRAFAVTGRSAVVEARRSGVRGELRFIDGNLSSAQLGSVEGLPALHQLLLWDDAALHFKFKNVVRRGTQLSMKSSEVTEECDRFLRDFAHETKELGFARTVYVAQSDKVQPSAAFPAEVVPLLRLFDGKRDLSQILEKSPFRLFDTLKIVKRFVADKAVRAKTPLSSPARDTGSVRSGPGALDAWLQRQAPQMGAEVGVGKRSEGASQKGPVSPASGDQVPRAGTAAGARQSSPFVAVPGAAGAALGRAESHPSEPAATAAARRQRPITQREHAAPVPEEDRVTPPPAPNAEAGRPPPPKPPAAVARGEIRSAATSPAMAAVPAPRGPTVLVEISPPPAPLPMASNLPPPVTAHSAPPSVIIAPMTPPPVVMPERPRHRSPTPAAGAESKRSPRAPSDNFNALESDFFDREADLYKRESVESFEDLDGTSRPVRPNGPPRKR